MIEILNNSLSKTIEILNALSDPYIKSNIITCALEMVGCIRNGKKIMFIGNGGSAADAQHFAAELVVRLKINRPSIPAIALTTDTSILTAIGNDFGFDDVFSRQIEGIGKNGDILFAITTSGKSPNILKALSTAKRMNIKTIVLTGLNGQYLVNSELTDIIIIIPSVETTRIQECHIVIEHSLSEIIENKLYKDKNEL